MSQQITAGLVSRQTLNQKRVMFSRKPYPWFPKNLGLEETKGMKRNTLFPIPLSPFRISPRLMSVGWPKRLSLCGVGGSPW